MAARVTRACVSCTRERATMAMEMVTMDEIMVPTMSRKGCSR
jgi:hypothetical protein